MVCVWCRIDQNGRSALLLACTGGHLDVARWLVTDAGSDARLERSNVSCCCSFRLYVSLLFLERLVCALCRVVIRMVGQHFWRRVPMVTLMWCGGL
jgi:hypothetical protein